VLLALRVSSATIVVLSVSAPRVTGFAGPQPFAEPFCCAKSPLNCCAILRSDAPPSQGSDAISEDTTMASVAGSSKTASPSTKVAAKVFRLYRELHRRFARSEDRRRAILSGYQMHLAKPVDPLELVAMVAGLVSRRGGLTREYEEIAQVQPHRIDIDWSLVKIREHIAV